MALSRRSGAPVGGSDLMTERVQGGAPGWRGPDRHGRGLSIGGLAARQLRLRGRWTASLEIGLTITFAVATLTPVLSAMETDAALHAAISGPAGLAPLTVARQKVPSQSAFEETQAQLAVRVDQRLGRHLSGSSALATLGPLMPVSLNENPAPAQVDSSRLAVGYLRDLTDHVELVAGGFPPDGLGGSTDIAATMSQGEADALGLHLGDRLCLDFAAGGTRWCARVAGLWRPIRGGDPFRLEAGRQVELVVGRYDFFRLMKLAAAPVATVGRQFYLDLNRLDDRDAGDVVSGLRQLRSYFTGKGDLFDTSLDRLIEDFRAADQPPRVASDLMSFALAAMALFGAVFVAGHHLQLQSRQLILARARGWPRRKLKRLLMVQLRLLVFVPLLAGAGLAAVLGAVVGPSFFGVPPPWPEVSDGLSAAAPPAAALAALAVLWTALSALAGRTLRVQRNDASDLSRRRGPRAAFVWLALPAGLALLTLAGGRQGRPLPLPPGAEGPLLDWARAVLSLIALLMLAAAASQALPLAGRLAGSGERRISGSLAGWQMARRPWQHRQVAFLMTVAVAVATFGILTAVSQQRQPSLPASAALAWPALGAVLIGLFAFATHFRVRAGERAEEYAALLLSGLPRRELRGSVAGEQRAVTWHALIFGGLCALALAVALLPLQTLLASSTAAGVFAGVLLAFLVSLLGAGWVTRSGLGRLKPGDRPRVLP